MRTEDLRAFLQIAETGSLSAAAAALGVPKSTLSRRLTRLEDTLEAQLVLRTPRAVQLTELGEQLRPRAASALAHLDDIERSVLERGEEPSGPLRISAPLDLAASDLGAITADFLGRYPGVEVSLLATNQYVDLISAGIDVALRIHQRPLASVASLRARKLAEVAGGPYASPEYLERAGRPRRPADLRRHPCLSMTQHPSPWTFTRARDATVEVVDITPRFVSNDNHAICSATERAAGIGMLPTFLGESRVRQGRLVRLLSAWEVGSATLSAVWPATHHTSPRVRAFIDAAVDYFDPPPWSG